MRGLLALGTLAAALMSTTSLNAQPLTQAFNRVASYPVALNWPADERADATVSEIVAATPDGMTLVYTDAARGTVGFIDIANPSAPAGLGVVDVGGDPTSVKIVGGKALVAVVTSESFTNPSGHLAIVDVATRTVDSTIPLGGQPDAVAVSPDGSFVAIAIENERDEDENDGIIPQLPAGYLVVLSVVNGAVDPASLRRIELTGLAEVAPEDPEVEFVDINSHNQAVITLQENNHLIIVDLASGAIVNHFSAGVVDIDEIDTEDDGVISPTSSLQAVPREPDAVQWIDDDRFVTADEGDYEGGSRSFTIFNIDGTIEYSSGNSFEHLGMMVGHYPDGRSDNKGMEPEGAAVGTFGDDTLLFIGSERGSIVAVYRDTGGEPELLQVLPAGIGPEGLLAIPSRNLFVVANEEDLGEDGAARAHVMIYELQDGAPVYPTIQSVAGPDGLPITWGAMSGLTADPVTPGRLYAITDSAFGANPQILTIDATQHPALIVSAVTVTSPGMDPADLDLDLEGIAARADGGFWLASEGAPAAGRPNRILRVAADGTVEEVIELPEAISTGATSSGFEGVTVVGSGADERVVIAVQREWAGDPRGHVKLLIFTPATGAWGMVYYPTTIPATGWVGLSEITYAGNDTFIIIERDNQIGTNAVLKSLYAVSLAGVTPVAPGTPAAEIPVLAKTEVVDLMPVLASFGGYIQDKVEGFAIDAAGNWFAMTDNDGVDDANGETLFMPLGHVMF